MMITKGQFTQTPNILFDELLRVLSNSEVKVLLVIIRKTYGWIDSKTHKRKVKDRISVSQFMELSGLSRRIISFAIGSLVEKKLICISDNKGNPLNDGQKRKGRSYIYYSSSIEEITSMLNLDLCKKRHQPVQIVIHNKRNIYKRNNIDRKESEYQQLKDVVSKNFKETNSEKYEMDLSELKNSDKSIKTF